MSSILFSITFGLPCFAALDGANNSFLACSKKVHVMPPPTQPVAAVFGGTRIGNRELFMPHTHLETFLMTLTRHHITKIDTAQAYGNSEVTLGRIKAGSRFVIDTKWSPFSWTESSIPWATNERIICSAEESIHKLAVDQVS
jgi:aflatoxin B1 aldehyde reductase